MAFLRSHSNVFSLIHNKQGEELPTYTLLADMHVSELRLPDPLDERESLASGSGGGENGRRDQQCIAGGDGYSECGMSDDHMSLPSSAGLSQLSLLTGEDDNDSENVASHQRAGMPVASSSTSTRLSSPSASSLALPAYQTSNTRKHTASPDTYSDVESSYSIISITLDCPSPSYSITGVRTTPQTPPLRSSELSAVKANVNGAKQASLSPSSSLPTNLKEYIDTLSAAEKQNGHYNEHQKNFDMWLKSVTPHSQRTTGSEEVSVMSSLGSPLPPSVQPASSRLVATPGAKSNVDLSCSTTRARPLFADRLLFLL